MKAERSGQRGQRGGTGGKGWGKRRGARGEGIIRDGAQDGSGTRAEQDEGQGGGPRGKENVNGRIWCSEEERSMWEKTDRVEGDGGEEDGCTTSIGGEIGEGGCS